MSPVTATVQSEINAFYEFAKEKEKDERGVHKLYVLSILRNIQRHTGKKLLSVISEKQPYFAPIQRKELIQQEDTLFYQVESMESTYVSLIQLTNILACANRQIDSDTLVRFYHRVDIVSSLSSFSTHSFA